MTGHLDDLGGLSDEQALALLLASPPPADFAADVAEADGLSYADLARLVDEQRATISDLRHELAIARGEDIDAGALPDGYCCPVPMRCESCSWCWPCDGHADDCDTRDLDAYADVWPEDEADA